MLLPGILLFVLCLFLSAFFSSSETAFIAVNPYSLEYQERQGSKRAALARKIRARTNELLATILIGNTLVNAAAASIATSLFVSVLPPAHRSQRRPLRDHRHDPPAARLRRDQSQDLRRPQRPAHGHR